MKIKRTDTPKDKSSGKKSPNSFFFISISIVVSAILLFFLWHQITFNSPTVEQDFNNRTVRVDISVPEPPPPNKVLTKKSTTLPDSKKLTQSSGKNSALKGDTTQKQIIKKATEQTIINPTKIQQGSETSFVSKISNQTTDPGSSISTAEVRNNSEIADATIPQHNNKNGVFTKTCSESTSIIQRFYNHLDAQEYMKVYGLNVSSEEHFTHLIQKLLDNPPVVSGETNDLFTILQNTAHFYRIIGKNNILVLKGILDREKDQFENVLNHYYSVFQTPSCPSNSFNLRVTETSLYDYAGFFLNTMGGRLYLFRRDSMSRIVVSYYAILLVDQANKEARNKYGIEIKTAIDQVLAELEASSKHFKLEQVYLDNLYSLKEQYQ